MKRFIAWIKRSRSKKPATRTEESRDPVSTHLPVPETRRPAAAAAAVPAPAASVFVAAHTAPKTAATVVAPTAANADRMAHNTAVETRAPTAQPSFVKSFSAPSGGDAVASFRESLSATRRRAAPPPPPLSLHIRHDPSAAPLIDEATRSGGGVGEGGDGDGGGSEIVRLSYSRPNSSETVCASTFESLASPSRPRDIPERPAAASHSRTARVYLTTASTTHDDSNDGAAVAIGSPAYSSLPTPESLMPPEMPRSLAAHLSSSSSSSSSYSAERHPYAHSPARTSRRYRPHAYNSDRDEAIAHSVESDDGDGNRGSGSRSDESDGDEEEEEEMEEENGGKFDGAQSGGGGGRVAENLRYRPDSTAPASGSDRQRRSREWHAEFRRQHAAPSTASRLVPNSAQPSAPKSASSVRTSSRHAPRARPPAASPPPSAVATSATTPLPTAPAASRPTENADDRLVRQAVTRALAHDRVWAVERHSWKRHESVWVDLCVLHRRCARRLTGTVCEYACSIQECGAHYYTFDYHSRRSAHLTWEMAARLRREELAALANAKPQGLSLLRSWRSTPEGLCR